MSTILNEIESGGLSHIGPVREENQDSICLVDDIVGSGSSLFAVADGMGGYSHGKLASNMAVETMCAVFKDDEGSPRRKLKQGIETANLNVYQTAQRLGVGRMGTTLTAAHLHGNRLTLAHVGDSRAYLLRDQNVTLLTRDHTVVGDMVRLKILSPDKVRTHTQRSILTRGLGLSPFITPDINTYTVKDNDVLIMCSDGLWSMFEDRELVQINQDYPRAQALVSRLIFMALERGTDDNISAVSVRMKSVSTAGLGEKLTGWKWLRSLGRPF